MAAQALNARVAAAAALKDTIRDVNRYIQKENPSQRLLQNKHDKLLEDKNDLFTKHCTYSELSKKSLDSEELLDWITPQMDAASDVLDEIILLIDEKKHQLSMQ